jgi:hypothetical protein
MIEKQAPNPKAPSSKKEFNFRIPLKNNNDDHDGAFHSIQLIISIIK